MTSVILVEYTSKQRSTDEFRNGPVAKADVVLEANEFSYRAKLALPYCRYTFLCRSVSKTGVGQPFTTEETRLRSHFQNTTFPKAFPKIHLFRVFAKVR